MKLKTIFILIVVLLITGCNQSKTSEIIHTVSQSVEKELAITDNKQPIDFEVLVEEEPEIDEVVEQPSEEVPEEPEEPVEVEKPVEPKKTETPKEPEISDEVVAISEEEKTALNISSIDAETGLFVVNNPDSNRVYVNKNRRLPVGYSPSGLVEPDVPQTKPKGDERRKLRAEAATALEALFSAALEEGLELAAVSGYRSHAMQTSIYQGHVSRSGQDFANRYSARPGTSEHESGLAMDVSAAVVGFALDEAFKSTEEGTWISDHAHLFGYIVRYPEGKEHITGFAFEPWHLRYVGNELAEHLYKNGLTLEEYFGYHYELNN